MYGAEHKGEPPIFYSYLSLCVDVFPTFSLLAKLESHLKDQSAFKELQELYNDFVTFLEVCTSVLQLMIWCSR